MSHAPWENLETPRGAWRRQAYLFLSALTTALQVLAALACWGGGDWVRLATSCTGVLLAAAMFSLGWRRPLPELSINRLAVLLAFLWLATEAGLAVAHRLPVRQELLLDAAILSVLAFTLLPIRQSVPVVGSIYLALLGIGFLNPATEFVPLLMNAVLVGVVGFMSVYGRSVSVEQARNAWLQELAFRDPLTGAANRHVADDELDRLLTLKAPPEDVAVVILDLDHFKRINDTLGHVRGDQALVHVAQRLRSELRTGDILARWGGEEFVVILHNVTPEQARCLTQRMLLAVQNTPLQGFPHLTVSGGGAMLREGGHRHAIMQLADERLYAAKHAGRNRVNWQS